MHRSRPYLRPPEWPNLSGPTITPHTRLSSFVFKLKQKLSFKGENIDIEVIEHNLAVNRCAQIYFCKLQKNFVTESYFSVH